MEELDLSEPRSAWFPPHPPYVNHLGAQASLPTIRDWHVQGHLHAPRQGSAKVTVPKACIW